MSKPFVERLSLDVINLRIISENRPKSSGFSQFKRSFLGQLWNNVKANWLVLLFCLPVIAWMLLSKIPQLSADSTIPYSGNIGIGYPVVNDAHIVGAALDFQLAMRKSLIMLPAIIFASLGLAGVFNVAKYLCWGFQIKIVKTFFKGIKNSFAPFIWVGLMLGICYLLINLTVFGFQVHQVSMGVKVITYIALGLVCFFVALLSLYITTQASVFNLSLLEILKNSLFLGSRFILQNVFILIAGLASMTLPLFTFNSIVQIITSMLFFFAAFSFTANAWTVYTHYLYEMIYESKAKTDSSVEIKVAADTHKAQGSGGGAKKAGSAAKPYKNPKKKKKND